MWRFEKALWRLVYVDASRDYSREIIAELAED